MAFPEESEEIRTTCSIFTKGPPIVFQSNFECSLKPELIVSFGVQ
jgi:hypothetical protein